jgi:glycosyltransferase involved in cell wall biosynthesis
VITVIRSSLPEITAGAAYLVNPHRPNEIATGITRILTDNQLKNRLIQDGLLQAQKFTWQTAARQWLNLIKD